MKMTRMILVLGVFPLGCVLNDVEGESDVVGTWFTEQRFEIPGGAPTDTVFLIDRFEMSFGEDYTMQKKRVVLEEETRVLLGFRYVSEGTYSANGLHLTMTEEKRGVHSDTAGIFTPVLIPMAVSPATEVVTYAIEGAALVFRYPPCPPDANCLESQTFFNSSR
ncbi:MAG: hypothetical protein HYZ01_06755 [Ignavibacteriales bacterium]|nr:hypothetical protein [Ignavibacteriales bacterium]